MMNDKIFKITVIALLILILGAVFGTLSSFYLTGGEHFIEFEEGEFIEDDADHFQINRYTYEEFGVITKKEIENLEDVIAYGESNKFDIEEHESDFVLLYKELGCTTDEIGRTLCFEEIIEATDEEQVVHHTVIGYGEHE